MTIECKKKKRNERGAGGEQQKERKGGANKRKELEGVKEDNWNTRMVWNQTKKTPKRRSKKKEKTKSIQRGEGQGGRTVMGGATRKRDEKITKHTKREMEREE